MCLVMNCCVCVCFFCETQVNAVLPGGSHMGKLTTQGQLQVRTALWSQHHLFKRVHYRHDGRYGVHARFCKSHWYLERHFLPLVGLGGILTGSTHHTFFPNPCQSLVHCGITLLFLVWSWCNVYSGTATQRARLKAFLTRH
jgi:hypothetical protein